MMKMSPSALVRAMQVPTKCWFCSEGNTTQMSTEALCYQALDNKNRASLSTWMSEFCDAHKTEWVAALLKLDGAS